MPYATIISILEPVAIIGLPMLFTASVIWALVPVRKPAQLPRRLILENTQLTKTTRP